MLWDALVLGLLFGISAVLNSTNMENEFFHVKDKHLVLKANDFQIHIEWWMFASVLLLLFWSRISTALKVFLVLLTVCMSAQNCNFSSKYHASET